MTADMPGAVVRSASGGRARPPRFGWRSERIVTALVFLAPALSFLGVFVVWPILNSIELSFMDWNGLSADRVFVGLDNWQRLVSDPHFWRALANNIVIVVLSFAVQLPIAMALAIVLHRMGRGSRLFKSIYFLPFLMSTVAVAVLFRFIYNPSFGVINPILRAVGLGDLTQDWLGDPGIALFSIIAVISWQFIPFYMILFLAQLVSIPAELREAARIDGASERQYTVWVELPLMKGIVGVAMVVSLIGSLKYFDLIWVMTQGGPARSTELMATYMYKQAFSSFDMGYGSAVATAMFVIVMVAAIGVLALQRWRGGERA